MNDWVPVPGFPGYSLNPLGEVRKDSSGRVLASKVNQWGVVYVGLMRENKQRQRSVALLVASTFIPHPIGPMDTPIHMDGDRYNNTVDNLVWRPRWFARAYNRQFKNSYHNSIEEPIRDIASREEFRNSYECAVTFGLLERDLVLSILNMTYVWPTYQQFEIV